MARQGRREPGSLKLVLPATSANLGPAFDCAALALRLFLTIKAQTADEFSIDAAGRDSDICGRLENNLIVETYTELLRREHRTVLPLALQIENEIPIGKGCGSSAAARLAGIALAVHFGGLAWGCDQITAEAARREQHADNAAACWLGGLCLAKMPAAADASCEVISIKPKGKWPLLLAVPETPLSTQQARDLLPTLYHRADAISNIQNSMFLVAAFMEGRPEQLGPALADTMHQPYRAELCPLLSSLQKLTGTGSILGAVLSGAGPSVLLFLEPGANVSRTMTSVSRHLLSEGLSAELLPTTISAFGASRSLALPGVAGFSCRSGRKSYGPPQLC